MTKPPLKTLVLAGTAEARAVIAALATDPGFDVEASLAGATARPLALPVPVHSGGFGGVDGLVAFCRSKDIALILDVTHPFANVISSNAAQAARKAGIRCLHYLRPAWTPEVGDRWRDFDNWQTMADALPSGAAVFLAGGTQSVSVFSKRGDIRLVARALNLADKSPPPHGIFINAMPSASVESEIDLLKRHDISLVCCKNSGGLSSEAKIIAARECGVEVWMLARKPFAVADDEIQQKDLHPTPRKEMPTPPIHDSVESIITAARSLAAAAANPSADPSIHPSTQAKVTGVQHDG